MPNVIYPTIILLRENVITFGIYVALMITLGIYNNVRKQDFHGKNSNSVFECS